MALEPTITLYVSLDLLTWQQQGALVLSPKFQRRSVWTQAARSYFIDTLLRGYPVPPLHLRLKRDEKRGGVVREVVDGQQRLRALFDFLEGKFRLATQLDAPWAGLAYDQLEQSARRQLQEFRFQVYQYQNVDDATILQIFARINTYSVQLRAQELRNGRFFGEFKQSAYNLALRHLEFWRSAGIFTEAAIARMSEAELVSELLIMQLDGMQDKKKSIDDFYRRLDETWRRDPMPWQTRGREIPRHWLSRRQSEQRFNKTMDAISEAAGDLLPESEFKRVPLFYSLYGVVYHRLFGVPGVKKTTPGKPLTRMTTWRLRDTLESVSELLSDKPRAEDLRGWRRDFVLASARQTDNVTPRRERFRIIWEQAELGGR